MLVVCIVILTGFAVAMHELNITSCDGELDALIAGAVKQQVCSSLTLVAKIGEK